MALCDRCGYSTTIAANEYAEIICDDCTQNEAEAAWERHCASFHDGGATQFITLQQQQIAARRLK